MLIKKLEQTGLKHCKNLEAFIGYSDDINDSYENVDEYNPSKKGKILIVFDVTIADVLSNKKIV